MSATGVTAFDSTLHTTHVWLNEICQEMEWEKDAARAYHALRAVLHALRDRLRPEEAAGFAAQLPMLIRGIFFEGWHPAGKPAKSHTLDEFLAPVAAAFRNDRVVAPEDVARAVFHVIKRHVTEGETKDIIGVLPPEVRKLWA